jgi:hypothetical protein
MTFPTLQCSYDFVVLPIKRSFPWPKYIATIKTDLEM